MKFPKVLKELGACFEGQDWVGYHGMKWAWENCEYPGWMLWFLYRVCEIIADEFSSWPELSQIEDLEVKIELKYSMPRSTPFRPWYLDCSGPENEYACNYIRKHVKLGKLSEVVRAIK